MNAFMHELYLPESILRKRSENAVDGSVQLRAILILDNNWTESFTIRLVRIKFAQLDASQSTLQKIQKRLKCEMDRSCV